MISPFFGLSVVIHVVVIIWHKTISFLFPNRKKRRIIKKHPITHFLGLLSIFAILTFVIFTGITILTASVLEKHSSVYVVEKAIPQITQFNYSGAYTEALSNAPSYQTMINAVFSLNSYGVLFLLSLASLLLILLWGDAIAVALSFIQKYFPLRKFFVAMGVLVLFVGLASLVWYMLPTDSVNANFTGSKFGLTFGK